MIVYTKDGTKLFTHEARPAEEILTGDVEHVLKNILLEESDMGLAEAIDKAHHVLFDWVLPRLKDEDMEWYVTHLKPIVDARLYDNATEDDFLEMLNSLAFDLIANTGLFRSGYIYVPSTQRN